MLDDVFCGPKTHTNQSAFCELFRDCFIILPMSLVVLYDLLEGPG
jgi:hypothetical protein